MSLKKTYYTLKVDNIQEGQLIDLTTHAWLDYNNNQIPWVSGSIDLSPSTGSYFYNNTGSLPIGYYKYNGNSWVFVTGSTENNLNFNNFQLPIFLESSVDEYGPMIDFDGNIINEIHSVAANFSYSGSCKNISITNTTDITQFKHQGLLSFVIFWGDGSGEPIEPYETKTHTYVNGAIYDVLIIVNTPYGEYKTVKRIDCTCK